MIKRLVFGLILIPLCMVVPLIAGIQWVVTGRASVMELMLDFMDWGISP